MSQSNTRRYEELQAEDYTDTRTAVTNLHQKNVRDRREKAQAEHEAWVRRLLTVTRKALAGETDHDIRTLLEMTHWEIRKHPGLMDALSPRNDGLDHDVKAAFQRYIDLYDEGKHPPKTGEEYVVMAEVAKDLKYISSISDTSQYAPVRYKPNDGRKSHEITPFGARRYGHDSFMTRDEALLEIPVESCDHQLTMAQPRRGKDSTNARCAGNLKDEHGYKWISLLDDGRNETPMIAIPSDDGGIRQSLEQMGQTPKGYPCTVYVPKMGDIPTFLPNNHEVFTLGTHQLTPELVLRLVGITATNSNTDRRIKTALDETVRAGGTISDLCNRLRQYAEESEATIEVVEIMDDPDGGSAGPSDGPVDYEDVDRITYQMDEDEALSKAAEQLAMLAGEGLIASPNVSTNIDFNAMIADQECVAVLNCNFLDEGDAGLHFTIMDIWAQLIYRARDESSRLPRVAMEIREMKSVCPSKLGDTRHKSQIKPLRQTLFFLTTQGGSRGVMLLGSTQKLTDMYKSARSNMAIHVILNLQAEGINELDDKHHFTHDQRQQIAEFKIGQGMIMAEGKPTYPINFAGARCGLGEKDREWRDRYGIAYGARVREGGRTKKSDVHTRDEHGWPHECDADYWIDVMHGTVHAVDEDGKPDLGRWFLLPDDLAGLTPQDLIVTPHAPIVKEAPPSLAAADLPDLLDEYAGTNEPLPEIVVRAGMIHRQEYVVPNDLMLKPTGTGAEQRSLTITSQNGDESDKERKRRLDEAGVPSVLHDWAAAQTKESTQARYLDVLRVVGASDVATQDDIATETGISPGSVSIYLRDPNKCAECVEKNDLTGYFELTAIGEKALNIDWQDLTTFE